MATLSAKGPAGVSIGAMPFIVSSSLDKVDPVTRKLIRSHVMRGKKQKHKYLDKGQRVSSQSRVLDSPKELRASVEEFSAVYQPSIPTRVGSDLSFIDFAAKIEASMLLNMAKVSNYALKVMFPLLGVIGFQAENKEWLQMVASDAATLHVTAFAVEEFIDRVLRCQTTGNNLAAMLHLQKGLVLLRERLLKGDDRTKITDSTVGTIMKLASAAQFNGDTNAAMQHMEGIRRIVDLRGGLDVFKGKQLYVDILRCDLSMAILNGSDPVFFRQPSEPVIKYPEKLLPTPNDHSTTLISKAWTGALDEKLATAWQTLRRFCLLVNLGMQTQRQVRPEFVYETMIAVVYRLLYMDYSTGTLAKAVHQGLLAFSYHIFLQWKDIRPPYPHFPSVYKDCILALQGNDEAPPELILWLLMTGANSIFDISEEDWLLKLLRDYFCKYHVKTWHDVCEILKAHMWIPLLDDKAGKEIFKAVVSHRNR